MLWYINTIIRALLPLGLWFVLANALARWVNNVPLEQPFPSHILALLTLLALYVVPWLINFTTASFLFGYITGRKGWRVGVVLSICTIVVMYIVSLYLIDYSIKYTFTQFNMTYTFF